MYKEIIPIRLKEARKRTGFTQIEVSELVGLRQNTLSRYELGTILPSIEMIGKLAEFYGVSLDWIFGLVLPQGTGYRKHEQDTDSVNDDAEPESFPARLKKARENFCYTQDELAIELGIGRSSISNYESGFREPDFETLAKLANCFGVTTDWLIGLSATGGNVSIKDRIAENRNHAVMLKKMERDEELARRLEVNT